MKKQPLGRSRLGDWGLAIAAVCIGLIASEWGLRLIYGDPQPFLGPQVRHVETPWGYKTEPLQRTFTGSQEVRTNSAGYRDREWQPSKSPGTTRVLAIGDSITFGNLVAAPETFAGLLSAQVGAGGNSEWLTAAVGGWNTIEERNFLKEEGRALAADLVVLFFFYNDYDTESQKRYTKMAPDGRIEGRPDYLRWLSYDSIFVLKRSALVRLLRDALDGLLNRGDYRAYFNIKLAHNEVDLESDPRIRTTYELLKDMHEISTANGGEFWVVFCPSIDIATATTAEPAFIAHLGAHVEALGARFLDPTSRFRSDPQPRELFMAPWDNHYSAKGHKVMAEFLRPAIEQWLANRPGR